MTLEIIICRKWSNSTDKYKNAALSINDLLSLLLLFQNKGSRLKTSIIGVTGFISSYFSP
jgi:hypothetical protein